MPDPLYWDSTYALALELSRLHPHVDLHEVTLSQIERWVLALPDFADDPQLVNDELLSAIYQDWFEEVNPL